MEEQTIHYPNEKGQKNKVIYKTQHRKQTLQHDLLSDKFMMHFKSIAMVKPYILEK
jgi:hypothetical protein